MIAVPQRLCLTVCAGLVWIHAAGAVEESELLRVLRQRGIPYDTNAVQAALVNTILRSADPLAVVLSSNETAEAAVTGAVAAAEWPDGICHLRVTAMQDGTGEQAAGHVQRWREAGKAGIILDLRAAGGGSLDDVDRLAGALLPASNAPLYAVLGGDGRRMEAHRGTGPQFDAPVIPVVVLVDRQTRDGSELLAALLAGTPGNLLLGTGTRGHLALRERVPLRGGESIWMATRWIALGAGVQRLTNSVTCDVDAVPGITSAVPSIVDEDLRWDKPLSDKARADRELMQKAGSDPWLLRAADILVGLSVLRPEPPAPRPSGKEPTGD